MKKIQVLIAVLLAVSMLAGWAPTAKAVQCGPAAKYMMDPPSRSCPYATLKIMNKTGAPITLYMKGPKGSYTITVPNGGNHFYSLPNGVYSYTAVTNCGCPTKSGKIDLKGKADWKWWCK
jgi:hypothetical protein